MGSVDGLSGRVKCVKDIGNYCAAIVLANGSTSLTSAFNSDNK